MISLTFVGIILFVFATISQLTADTTSVFEIQGVEVRIPLPIPANQNPRSLGLARAENIAFKRLFNRMLTQSKQEYNQDFLNNLRREKKKYIERTIVRSERRRLREFHMTVDVTFSKKEVSEAFAKAGMAHGNTLYPETLLLIKSDSQKYHDHFQDIFIKIAKQYGISLRPPLGDMEDMLNLTWENAANSTPQFQEWVKIRYGLERMLTVHFNIASTADQAGKEPYFSATAQLLETNLREPASPTPIQARAESNYSSGNNAIDTLFTALANQLVQQITDLWIANNAVEPILRHTIPIRIVHNFQHYKYNQFLQSLQTIPGFAGFQYRLMTAHEVVIDMDYLGLDNTLFSAISQMGVQIQSDTEGIVVHLR